MHESRSPHRIMGKLLSVAARQGKINRIMESLTSRETIQILRSHKIIEITEIIKTTEIRVPAPSSTTRRRCSGAPFDPIECPVGPRKRLIPRLLVPNHNPAPRLFPWRRGNSSGWPKVGVRNLGPTGVKKLRKSQKCKGKYKGNTKECRGFWSQKTSAQMS